MGGIEAGKAFVKFLLDDKELKKGLTKVGAKLQSVGKIGTAATAPIIAGFAACTKAFVDAGSQLTDLSERTGISGAALSELSFAADQTGTNIETLAGGVSRLQKNIGNAINGTGTFDKTLTSLGLNLQSVAALNPEQQFLAIADALSRVVDPAERVALAQKAFGGASKELLPLLTQGAEGIAKFRQEAIDLGDEQLLEWVEAIMRGETFICPLADVPAMERILASMELLRELQRRREVAALEDEATG